MSRQVPYSSGQANFLRALSFVPNWFILGGPADGDEAQTVIRFWPNVKVIAVEPVAELRRYQLSTGFPDGGVLLPNALWDSLTTLTLAVPDTHRRASLVRDFGVGGEGKLREVETITLDRIDEVYGPINNAVLWLDIEGAELEALKGGTSLFNRRAIRAVSVEVIHPDQNPEAGMKLDELLWGHGFVLDHVWNPVNLNGISEDRLYLLQ